MSVGAFIGLVLVVIVVTMMTGFLRMPISKDWRSTLSQPTVRAGKFTEAVAQAVEELHPGTDARILAPLQLEIRVGPDGQPGELDLRPLFESVSLLPASRAQETERYLRSALTLRGPLPAERGILLEKVLPVLRNAEFIERSRQDGEAPWSRKLVGDLLVCLVEDRADTLAFLTPEQVRRLGGSEEALYQIALKNLAAIKRRPQRVAMGLVQGLEWDGGEPSSLLLRPDAWTAEQTGIQGKIIAATPSRDLVLYTSAETPGGAEALRSMVAQLAARDTSGHPLSTRLYVRDAKGAWRARE